MVHKVMHSLFNGIRLFGKNQNSEARVNSQVLKYENACGTPVRGHVMMITIYFMERDLHGAQSDEVTQVKIIHNSLSNDFI